MVPLEKADRSFDIEFWQAQSATKRFNAAFSMLEDYYRTRGKKIGKNTFRLQKNVERLRRIKPTK